MYIVGFIKDGQREYLRKGEYVGNTPDPMKARVFRQIGHIKTWALHNPSYARGALVIELKFELGLEMPIEEIYK